MKLAYLFFLIPLIVVLVIFMPIIVMWCVDTLFGTNIPINLKTWFAAFLLLVLIGKGSVSSNKS